MPNVREDGVAARRPTAGSLQLSLWTQPPGPAAGELVRAARTAQHWTQARLAESLGVSQSTLSRLERGALSLTLDEVVAIADTLACPLASLLGGSRTSVHRARGRRRQGSGDLSRRWAGALPAALLSEFLARGGSLRALRLAREGRQPLSARQAAILVGLGAGQPELE